MTLKLGNIVTTSKISTLDGFIVTDDIKNIIPDLPTLVVGWELMSSIFPDMDMTNKKYNDNFLWTYSLVENRREHLIDMEEFIHYSLKKMISKTHYVPIDTIHITRSTFKKIYNKIMSTKKMCSYIHEDRIVYIVVDNIIFSIDLELYKFLGLDPEKIKSKIKVIPNNTLLSSEILIEYKEYIDRLDYNVKYAPYMYSIDNGESITNS